MSSESSEPQEADQFLAIALRRDERDRGIGDNRGLIDEAREVFNRVSFWLREHPIIATSEDAKDANEHFGATQRCLRDMEAERKVQVEPLTEQVTLINTQYRSVRQPIERALDELKRRLTAYVAAEERARAAGAAKLRAAAEAKERAAREAEAREADAIASVDVGVCDDAGGAIADADAAFAEFQRADRAAATAEHNVTVKLRDRFSQRARSMRNSEVLTVSDAAAALAVLGVTERIAEAIVSEARAYRKAHGTLPPGIAVQWVRSL
jgi:hypothetical protein